MKDVFKFLTGPVKPRDLLKLIAEGIGLDTLCNWHRIGYRNAGRDAAPEVPAATANAIADAAVREYWRLKLPK